MASYYGQYPDIYSKDDTRYTYFYDSGERITLIAGENGVTQEWIHALKLEHRSEYNMMRRGVKAGNLVATRLLSLDQYMEEIGDKGEMFMDTASDVETNYIAGIEAAERRERIQKALASLTSTQRELLIRVRVNGVTITAIAREQGVTEEAIRDRLRKIEKKIVKNFSQGATI